MRSFLLGALLCLGAAPLAAQQDSAARRDSLLERERRRIRGEAVARVPEPLRESSRAPTWAVALGLVLPAGWQELGGSAPSTMGTGVGVRLGVEGVWPGAGAVDYVAALRASGAGPEADDYDLAGDFDPVLTLDLLAGVEWRVGGRTRLRGAGGLSWVRGPDALDPWAHDAQFAPALDLSASFAPLRGRGAWALAAGVHAMRYSGGGPAAEAGTVLRPWLEIRRAF